MVLALRQPRRVKCVGGFSALPESPLTTIILS
jgi:hypothetical protein